MESRIEGFEEQAAEEAGEHFHGKEVARSAGDPALVIGGKSAAGDNAVQMRVMEQVLSPGMQYGEEADAGAEMLRVACNGEECFRRFFEPSAVTSNPANGGHLKTGQ